MGIKQLIKKRIPILGKLYSDLEKYRTLYPPGHYYSPIANINDIKVQENQLFIMDKILPGINLNPEKQFELLNHYQRFYRDFVFNEEPIEGHRFYLNNYAYNHADSFFLFSTINHFQPSQIIEIGSGFSSALMLDINEKYFANSINLTFIEPYPERLFKLVKPLDKFELKQEKLQDISLNFFDRLHKGDILFIDSTHVSKIGSDVNYLFFEILPRLNPGVIIHFHDIFYPFEYPKKWYYEWKGFAWNEIYLLRAFLMYNDNFEIILFNTFLANKYNTWFQENIPKCLSDKGGSIWLQKK